MNIDVTPSAAAGQLDPAVPEIGSVGVIGAGQMGNGIAHVCALAGLTVVLADVKAEALEKAMAVMGRNMDRQVSRGTIDAEDKAAALARITTTTDYADFGDCDLVIEAATEKEEVKRRDLQGAAAASEAGLPAGVQHLLDLHHPPGREDRPPGEIHRHALHEPGSGHEAGGDHPRHRHG